MNKLAIVLILFVFLAVPVFAQTAYTPSTETTCNGNICTKTLYSGIMFAQDENGTWTNASNVFRITKDSDDITFHYNGFYGNYSVTFEAGVIYNNNYFSFAEVKQLRPAIEFDFPHYKTKTSHKYAVNMTGIDDTTRDNTQAVTLTYKSHEGFTIDQLKQGDRWFTVKDMMGLYFDDLLEKHTLTINKTEKRIYILNITENVVNGSLYLDPTVTTLQDADTENLEDTYVSQSNPTTNYGTSSSLYLRDEGISSSNRIYLKFNISSVGTGVTILNATLGLNAYLENLCSNNCSINVHTMDNYTWSETAPTWNNPVGGTFTYVNTLPNTENATWKFINITNGVQNELGNDNITLYINMTGSYQGYYYFSSKESVVATSRPFLNITYQGIGISSHYTYPATPIFGNNVTAIINSTSTGNVTWCNFTVTSPADGAHFTNVNGTNYNTDLWNSSTFIVNGTADGQWNISVTCADDLGNTSILNWSFSITDALPVVDNVNITPSPAEASDNLTGACNFSDTDNLTITYYYQWFNDSGAMTGMTTENLTSGNFTGGDNITFQCIVNDGYKNSTAKNSSTMNIGDSINPIVEDWKLSASTGYTDTAETIYVNCSDTGSLIEYVRVEFINPNGENVGNKTMTNGTGNQYTYSYTFNVAGTYTNFTFHCKDQSGNTNTTSNTSLTFTSAVRPGGGGGGGGVIISNISFSVDPKAFNDPFVPGGKYTYRVAIHNNEAEALTFRIYLDGDESVSWFNISQDSVTVGNTSYAIVIITSTIPLTVKPSKPCEWLSLSCEQYKTNIIVEYSDGTQKVVPVVFGTIFDWLYTPVYSYGDFIFSVWMVLIIIIFIIVMLRWFVT